MSVLYYYRYSVLSPGGYISGPSRGEPSGETPHFGGTDPVSAAAGSFCSRLREIAREQCPQCSVMDPVPVTDDAGDPTGALVVVVSGPSEYVLPRTDAILSLGFDSARGSGVRVTEREPTQVRARRGGGTWWSVVPVLFSPPRGEAVVARS